MSNTTLYNDGVETYVNVAEQWVFRPPAKEITQLMADCTNHSAVGLDIGTGTGVLLSEAKKQFGEDFTFFGLDASKDMLAVARRRGFQNLIYSKLPNIPFLENTFDVVTANFVVAHIKNSTALVHSIYDVLKKDGHFIFTAWGKNNSDYNVVWNRVLYKYLSKNHIKTLANQLIPHEAKFNNPTVVIREMEKDNKFILSENYINKFSMTLSLADYLACRYAFLVERYLKNILSDELWNAFTDEMYQCFLAEFGTTIKMTHHVHFFVFRCNK